MGAAVNRSAYAFCLTARRPGRNLIPTDGCCYVRHGQDVIRVVIDKWKSNRRSGFEYREGFSLLMHKTSVHDAESGRLGSFSRIGWTDVNEYGREFSSTIEFEPFRHNSCSLKNASLPGKPTRDVQFCVGLPVPS